MGANRDLSTDELVGAWTLLGDDWELLGNKSGVTRLGFALLLKFFELEARFPRAGSDFPHGAVGYIADQVRVDAEALDDYEWAGRTAKRHRTQIRDVFGFREFTRNDEAKIAEWLAREVCPLEQRDEQLREAVLVLCRSEQVEPPGRIEKFGVRGLTKSAALDLGRHGIRVNSVHPGVISTSMTADTPMDMSHVALGRIGHPGEVADLVLYLSSNESSFVTGAEFVIDGGDTAGTVTPHEET